MLLPIQLCAVLKVLARILLICCSVGVVVYADLANHGNVVQGTTLPLSTSPEPACNTTSRTMHELPGEELTLKRDELVLRKIRHRHPALPSNKRVLGNVVPRNKRDMTPAFSRCWQPDVTEEMDLRHGHAILHVVMIAPYSRYWMFSMDKVLPAVHIAEDTIRQRSLLTRFRFHWLPGDSKCNSRDAPIHAFNMVTRYPVALFLGPVCDYSLAPVARYAPYWNIPIVAPGGFAHNFGEEKLASPEGPEYPFLTRVGYPFNALISSFLDVMTHFRWYKVKFIYDSRADLKVVPAVCHLAAGAFAYYLVKEDRRKFDAYIIQKKNDSQFVQILTEEVGTYYSGK